MKILRTPDRRFKKLPDYPFLPHYITVDGIRIHYIDEGPENGESILLMHGEPSWSYLYRHIIPLLVKEGFRVVAPDLVGFGKSDKPSRKEDYTYQKHVQWVQRWLETVDLKNITLFCQDWGSLIGLRLAIYNKDRFSRIILANGGLPAPTPTTKMPKAFYRWRDFSRNSPVLPIGKIIQMGTYSQISKDVLKGYKAPFPNWRYKAGARIFPSLVPITHDDPEAVENAKLLGEYSHWERPFLTAFSNKDPITRGGEKLYQKIVPGASGRSHPIIVNAGHFLQEDKGEEIALLIREFIQMNPLDGS